MTCMVSCISAAVGARNMEPAFFNISVLLLLLLLDCTLKPKLCGRTHAAALMLYSICQQLLAAAAF